MKYVIISAVALTLTACGSAPKTQTSQFCNTSKTIEVVDGNAVSSRTTVKCSDDFIERHVPSRMGVDRNCREVITQFGRNYACETHRPGYFVYVPDPANLK